MSTSADAMALYLCSWLYDPDGPTPYLQTVRETIADARKTFARRGMNVEDSLRASYEERIAEHGQDEGLLAWAERTATAMADGSLPSDPEHRDTLSPYSYRGVRLTYGDLEEIYGADLPDGSD
jgi:hypothetical protein